MINTITTISPISNEVCYELVETQSNFINEKLDKMVLAQKKWAKISLEKRISIIQEFIHKVLELEDWICSRLSIEMGRPIRYCKSEVKGFVDRAMYMLKIAKDCLRTKKIDNNKYIEKKPLGVVMIISAWNYPYLTSVNGLIPALLSGNAVIFKGSSQTPTTGITYESCFKNAGFPEHLFLNVNISHKTTENLVADRRINFVAFTGSVKGGQIIANKSNDYNLVGLNNVQSIGFKPMTLELGGKDPAYVREDADLEFAAKEIASGTFFNSGQCCCAIERVYVHKSVYDRFIDLVKIEAEKLILKHPLSEETTMGPLAKPGSADIIREKVQDSIDNGATQIVNKYYFPMSKFGSNYLAPQILINVNHKMRIIREETFGPVMPIMSVDNDDEAIKLMNDCKYGLTASIWTNNIERGEELAQEVEAGTVYINRCDYLDPALAWTGVKETGMGCSLSSFVFDSFTRLKSYYVNRG